MDIIKKFDPSEWALIRAFNTGSGNRYDEIKPDENGNYTALPADGENCYENKFLPVWQLGFEWDEPHDILGIKVKYADGFDSSAVEDAYVQSYVRVWPTPTPEHSAGAHRGWENVDDSYNGRWMETYGEINLGKDGCSAEFDHVDINEGIYGPGHFCASDDYNVFFRRTLKIRMLFVGKTAPVISGFELVGNPTVTEKECEIYSGLFSNTAKCADVGVYNGNIIERAEKDNCIRIKYTANEGTLCNGDRTLIEIDCGGTAYSFSVYSDDADKGVYMSDYGMLITAPLADITPEEKVSELTSGKESIFDRVAVHDEQTSKNALEEIPELDITKQPPYGLYTILGWNGLGKRFGFRYNGDIFSSKVMNKPVKRELKDTYWAAEFIHFRIATGDPIDRHENRFDCRMTTPDATVPIYVNEWTDREIEYKQTCFAIPADTSLIDPSLELRGDEAVVVLCRFEVRNTNEASHVAKIIIEDLPAENLKIMDGKFIAADGRIMPDDTVTYGWRVHKYGKDLTRLGFKKNKGNISCIPMPSPSAVTHSIRPGALYYSYSYTGKNTLEMTTSMTVPTAVMYECELGAYETDHIDVVIPYNTPISDEQNALIDSYDFDDLREKVTDYWHAFYGKGAKIDLPDEKLLNDFQKAIPWHVLISASREPDSGNYVVPAGTFTYSACGNEACMQIRMMDYLGHHDIAERYLDAFVNAQGLQGLDGDFKSKEGAFFAMNFGGRGSSEGQFAYNLDHGYIMTCFADHYFLTGDKEWLKKYAKNIVDGCEFVIRERAATKIVMENGEKVYHYGMLPHGHLEDNREWRCWFAVNAHACNGMFLDAKALYEIDHPDADRIFKEAEEYKKDIIDCMVRGIARNPAVPDGRGGYIPHVPTQVEIRGRDLGWFREAAYGPLHLTYGVLDPNDKIVEWILRDLEDNLFISKEWGRIADKEKNWFSHGGITIQSNLLFNEILYLQRNEPERALRAMYNNFAQNLYRSVPCFTEHPVPQFGYGYGPFFKVADEAQFVDNVRNHLLREDGETLHVLGGASREWFASGKKISFKEMATYFGSVSVQSYSTEIGCTVSVEGNWRKAPDKLILHIRRPDKNVPVSVKCEKKHEINGEEITVFDPDKETYVEVIY